MRATNTNAGKQSSPLSALGFGIGLVLCWLAAIGSLATYVPWVERQALFEVLAMVGIALAVLGLAWRRLPRLARILVLVFDVPVALCAIWVSLTRLA